MFINDEEPWLQDFVEDIYNLLEGKNIWLKVTNFDVEDNEQFLLVQAIQCNVIARLAI